MNRAKMNKILEYLSLILILSYLLNNNIFLVLAGILLSLYLINIEFIKKVIHSINKSRYKDSKEKYSSNNIQVDNLVYNKENSKLKLVETIEELGFIPSIDEDNNTDVA